MPEDIASILLVEDNRLISFQLSNELKELGYQIISAFSGEEAIKSARTCNPDIILMDVNLDEDRDGVEIMRIIHDENGFIPNIFLTGYSKEELVNRIENAFRAVILEKPVKIEALKEKIKLLALNK